MPFVDGTNAGRVIQKLTEENCSAAIRDCPKVAKRSTPALDSESGVPAQDMPFYADNASDHRVAGVIIASNPAPSATSVHHIVRPD